MNGSWSVCLALCCAATVGCRNEQTHQDGRTAPPEPLGRAAPSGTATGSARVSSWVQSAVPDRAAASAEPAPPPAVDGASATAVAAASLGRVYAKTRFVWVYPEPDVTTQWLGYLRTGSSVALRSAKPRVGNGCSAFYAVEPQGYVCAEGSRATTDPNDPLYLAIAPFAAKVDTAFPHHYAESLGLQRYFSLPTPELQRQREGDLRTHLQNIELARQGQVPPALQGVDVSLPKAEPPELPALPVTMFEDRRALKRRSTLSYSTEARIGDRGFLLSGDFAWVPKDRVRPYPEVRFRGRLLGRDAQLPLAYFRREGRHKYVREAPGRFRETDASFERLGFVELNGTQETVEDERYLETREAGVWLRERDVTLPKPSGRTPWDTVVGSAPKVEAGAPRKSWIEISVEGGWLIAYEDTQPVFVTLISPGRGGAARPGEDPLERSASPIGRYPITGKFVSSTMEAPNDLIHSDVPFAQNLVGPYALHGAYWHDNFGNPQSGGCINLAPLDAKWLFDFSDPKVPSGWYGVRWIPKQGPATVVLIHR